MMRYKLLCATEPSPRLAVDALEAMVLEWCAKGWQPYHGPSISIEEMSGLSIAAQAMIRSTEGQANG